MGSKVVVTYKRKRLFSRSDHSHINLQSESKASANFGNLQNRDRDFGICHECSNDDDGGNVGQCHDKCSEDHATKLQKLCPLSETQNFKQDPTSQSNAEEKSADTRSILLAKPGSENEDCRHNKDQYSSLSKNSGTKRKLSSVSITFSRRSKRIREVAAPYIASQCTDTGSGDVTNDKKPPDDIDNSCSLSAPASATPTYLWDNLSTSPHETAENVPSAIARTFQDSPNEMASLQGKVCTDVQDTPDEDETKRGLSRKTDASLSLDLSISPHSDRDIDCNRPLDCGSDEPGPSEVLVDTTSKIKNNMPALHVHCKENGSPVKVVGRDKGKFVIDSPPSASHNYLQLFPENRSNDSEKSSQLQYSSSLKSEQILNSHAYYEWPNVHLQCREPLHDFLQSSCDRGQSFARHQMLLDNILSRARAVRGHKSSYIDKFEPPTTWSEEELDSLWIGVRRHGRGNWEAILTDHRLNFSPWKTPRDLSERWLVEQSQLFYSIHVSQPRYAIPQDFPSDHVHSLLHPQPVKGSLPHWLKEAVEAPAMPSDSTQMNFPPGIRWAGSSQQLWSNNRYAFMQSRNAQTSMQSRIERHGKTEPQDQPVSKKDGVIVIPSDASSEETISDDLSVRT